MNTDPLGLARQAIQGGETSVARRLVARALLANPADEQAWLLMARLADTREQVIDCLEHALRLNPANHVTQSALKAIQRGQPPQKRTNVISSVASSPQVTIQAAGTLLPLAEKETIIHGTLVEREAASGFSQPSRRKLNLSLLCGGLIVFIVVLIALIGPSVAPQDPMQEHAIIQVGDKWFIPPFSAFQVPGFILGSDQFGRDMLSRILFAVRPTLTMVSVVAIVRLFLGTLIGLGAGWSASRFGQLLDGLISAALAVPILLVALAAITVLGAETGLLAFVVGLSINGWGETARLVRQQTQLIKGQLFVESARSLGSSSWQILFRHILRQIMPMIWMLFAFEISGTLMVTAGLGFLGYYIGGDVWIEVADFVSRRTSGAPELGQMLATSWVNLLQPWPLVLTGSIVFFTILGFNLTGNGLRSRLDPEYINRNSLFALVSQRVKLWLEESITYPVSQWLGANRLRQAMAGLAIVLLGGSIYLYQTRVSQQADLSTTILSVPGGQIWASERIDPYGSAFFNSIGPQDPARLWVVNQPAGFSGSPVVSADGIIYAASVDGSLLAINPDGSTRWKKSLPEIPVGSLALGPDGDIYITGVKGGLAAFSPSGDLLWTYTSSAYGTADHGAIVAPDGKVYYLLDDPRGDTLIALNPNGQLAWIVQPGTRAADMPLRLSPDGTLIFVKDKVVISSDGSPVKLTLPTQNSPIYANQSRLFVGADGKTYFLAGHIVVQWVDTSGSFTIQRSANWDYRSIGFNQNSALPVDAGVTPEGDIWLFYSGYWEKTSIYWLSMAGDILGSSSATFDQDTHLVAIDRQGTAYICGNGLSPTHDYVTMCQAYRSNAQSPSWSYSFDQAIQGLAGVAMAPGRMYVTTQGGYLIALGDSTTPSSTSSPTP